MARNVQVPGAMIVSPVHGGSRSLSAAVAVQDLCIYYAVPARGTFLTRVRHNKKPPFSYRFKGADSTFHAR